MCGRKIGVHLDIIDTLGSYLSYTSEFKVSLCTLKRSIYLSIVAIALIANVTVLMSAPAIWHISSVVGCSLLWRGEPLQHVGIRSSDYSL